MNASFLNAAVCILCKGGHENGLQYVHDGMMGDPIWEIWKAVHIPLFRIVDFEHFIWGSGIGFIQHHFLQGVKILLPPGVVMLHAVLIKLSFSRFIISQLEVLQAANGLV